MQIRYTGQNVEITSSLKDYTEKKLHRIHHHLDIITDVHVIFNIEKHDQIVEGNINVPGNHIHARATSENMYESVDKMADKLIRQLIKYKEKISDHS